MSNNTGEPAFPLPVGGKERCGRFENGCGGMSLRDAVAISVRLPDGYSAKWGEVLIGERYPNDIEPVSARIDWWIRVEAVYRYRMADAMLKAREVNYDSQ